MFLTVIISEIGDVSETNNSGQAEVVLAANRFRCFFLLSTFYPGINVNLTVGRID